MVDDSCRSLVIAGAGGFGREIAGLLEKEDKSGVKWNLIGFVDDKKQSSTIEGYPVLGSIKCIFEMTIFPWVAIAIADAHTRKRIFMELKDGGVPIATLIHPKATLSPYVSVGEGSIICSGSILTTNTTLGKCCIVNPGCFVGHDTVLSDWSSLMPHSKIAGEVTVGEGSYFGINSSVINRISIGEWSIVGAGATVTHDIPAFSLAVGVPARIVKKLDNGNIY